jgi:hypothetical protein
MHELHMRFFFLHKSVKRGPLGWLNCLIKLRHSSKQDEPTCKRTDGRQTRNNKIISDIHINIQHICKVVLEMKRVYSRHLLTFLFACMHKHH